MNDQQIAERGRQASEVLDNPAFQDAMKSLKDMAFAQFKRTDLRDAEGLRLARQFCTVTDEFEEILRRMIGGGKLAEVNLDRHRNEATARRVLRQVMR